MSTFKLFCLVAATLLLLQLVDANNTSSEENTTATKSKSTKKGDNMVKNYIKNVKSSSQLKKLKSLASMTGEEIVKLKDEVENEMNEDAKKRQFDPKRKWRNLFHDGLITPAKAITKVGYRRTADQVENFIAEVQNGAEEMTKAAGNVEEDRTIDYKTRLLKNTVNAKPLLYSVSTGNVVKGKVVGVFNTAKSFVFDKDNDSTPKPKERKK